LGLDLRIAYHALSCIHGLSAHLQFCMQTSAVTFYTLVACAVATVAWLLAQPLWLRWHRGRMRGRVFPTAWRNVLRHRVPLYARLPADLQLRLRQEMLVFLAEKPFLGCAGLQVTDEMRVMVAAFACLLLLGARHDYYADLQRILLYPGAFAAQEHQVSNDGVHSDVIRGLAGQSWVQGQVLLSWADVQLGAADPADGRNVVIHEFAHQLDQSKGYANGAPPLRSQQAYRGWSAVMQTEFDALRQRLVDGEDGLIGAYAATDPAEFFAVCSELFFERAAELSAQHPLLFDELKNYYRINPLSWS
jgi:Mlc titration factor MtfA (ptsG expression regulator)